MTNKVIAVFFGYLYLLVDFRIRYYQFISGESLGGEYLHLS